MNETGARPVRQAMVGTPFCPCALAARGPSILCMEDIGEPPYRLDRMWQQLKLGGVLRYATVSQSSVNPLPVSMLQFRLNRGVVVGTSNVVAILLGNFVPREPGAESPFSIFEGRPQGPPSWPDGTEKW